MARGSALLVERLERAGIEMSAPVRDALLAVDRAHFVPAQEVSRAHDDTAVVTRVDHTGSPISSASQPAIVARMLDVLDVVPGSRVLEIGTATGYNAALLKHIVGDRGHVTSVELDPSLADGAEAALRRAGYDVEVVCGDGTEGVPDRAPFDRVVFTASAWTVSRTLFDQLADGGLLEVPLRVAPSLMFPQLIPVFRKDAARSSLVSERCIAGGFMGVRQDARDDAPAFPHVADTVSDATTSRAIARLSGGAVAKIGEAGARQLLRTSLGEAGVRRALPAVDGLDVYHLYVFLGFALPDESLISAIGVNGAAAPFGGDALGVWDEASGDLALLNGDGPVVHRCDSWGSAAGSVLVEAVEDWHARGRPGLDRLALTLDFGGRPPPDRWRRQARGEAWLEVAWDQ